MRRTTRHTGLCLVIAVLLGAAASAAGVDRYRVRLLVEPFDAAIEALEAADFDVAGRDALAGTVDVIVDGSERGALPAYGEVVSETRSRPFREVVAELGADAPEDRYKTYGEVLQFMDDVAAAHPSIARKIDLNEMLGTPLTEEGRRMYAMKISDDVELDQDEVTILFDTLHHARELNTIDVALDIIDQLTSQYGVAPKVTRWVDEHEIWVVPVVNPDGLEYVWSDDQFWRKNRRDSGDGNFGVDLNRNYPFQWGECGSNSGFTGSETYRGPAPTSEPEVQTMVALGERIRPAINNSYHSFGREVLPPYTCGTVADPTVVDRVRDLYRDRMSYAWRFASSSGESFEWFYNQASSIAFLTEISTDFQPPFEEVLAEVERVRPGWNFLLDALTRGPLVQGTVTDAVTGAPVVAEVSSTRVPFEMGERRACEATFGSYAWLLDLGPHGLTFTADGYTPRTVPVLSAVGGVELDVQLDPAP